MNDRNRAFFERLAPAFAEAETDDLPSDEVTTQRIADANAARIIAGREALGDAPIDPPELKLYQRARALGHRRHRS